MKSFVTIVAGAVIAGGCANLENQSSSADEPQVAAESAGADYNVAGTVDADAAAGNMDSTASASGAAGATAARTPKDFAAEALQLSRVTVEASELAVQNSTNAEVKAFAAKAQSDHEAIVSRLEAAYPEAGPVALDVQRAQEIAELRASPAADFDEEYLDLLEDSHEQAIAMYRGYGDAAPEQMAPESASEDGQMAQGDADIEEAALIAQEKLAMLETHLAEIRRLDAQVDPDDDMTDINDD